MLVFLELINDFESVLSNVILELLLLLFNMILNFFESLIELLLVGGVFDVTFLALANFFFAFAVEANRRGGIRRLKRAILETRGLVT